MSNLKTLRAFVAAWAKVDGPPSVGEVAVELGLPRSTAQDRMAALVDNGLLEKTPGRRRGFALTVAGKRVVGSN